MFTGIVEEVGRVAEVTPTGLAIAARIVLDDMALGSSICVNGACLTVTSLDDAGFSVDVVPETLRRTNLGASETGNPVNLERPVAVDGRLDGHIVQGHVDGTGVIDEIGVEGDALLVKVQAPGSVMRYVVEKGFIAVDGASLTVVNCDWNAFTFTVIPYTRENTVLGVRREGDRVNLEVDMIAKYVERLSQASRRAEPPL